MHLFSHLQNGYVSIDLKLQSNPPPTQKKQIRKNRYAMRTCVCRWRHLITEVYWLTFWLDILNMIDKMDICSLMRSLLSVVLAEVKCMSRTELWETFLTSYTEVVKIHRSVATILNQNQCILNRRFCRCCVGSLNIQFKVNKDTVSGCLTLLFCWSWLACNDRATLPAIVYFEWSPPRAQQSLWEIMRAQHLESCLFTITYINILNNKSFFLELESRRYSICVLLQFIKLVLF